MRFVAVLPVPVFVPVFVFAGVFGFVTVITPLSSYASALHCVGLPSVSPAGRKYTRTLYVPAGISVGTGIVVDTFETGLFGVNDPREYPPETES